MLGAYFLIGVFAVTVMLMIASLIVAYRVKDDRGGAAFFVGCVLFAAACVSAAHAFWRLEEIDKAIAVERHRQQRQ